ncbi:MAG: heavy metal-responsive transcriptional regulator [Actinomycetota bacterium]
MRIGELARRTRIPTKTIRYYEGIGLLPDPPRTSSGYRDYEPTAERRLSFIRAAQSVGLSLGEIREILAFRDRGERPCEHVRSLIEQQAADLSARIAALEVMRRDLRRMARKARSGARSATEPAGYCHIIESA